MGITQQKIEEQLSVAYATAVVAKTGHTFSVVPQDYGVDVSIRRISRYRGEIIDSGPVLECQFKSTINYTLTDSHVIYDMEASAVSVQTKWDMRWVSVLGHSSLIGCG